MAATLRGSLSSDDELPTSSGQGGPTAEHEGPARVSVYGLVTVSDAEVDEGGIWRLLDSVPHGLMRCLVVLRGDRSSDLLRSHPAVVEVMEVPPCGLSRARNAGLVRLSSMDIPPSALLTFPDDDGRYPAGFIETALECIENGDLLLGSYGLPGRALREGEEPLSLAKLLKHANSVGIIVRWGLAKIVGGFDENLGVGSPALQAGEDLDFLIRAYSLSKGCRWVPGLVFEHPRSATVRPERIGVHLAIARRAIPRPWACLMVIKGFLSATVGRGDLTLRIFADRMRAVPRRTCQSLSASP